MKRLSHFIVFQWPGFKNLDKDSSQGQAQGDKLSAPKPSWQYGANNDFF